MPYSRSQTTPKELATNYSICPAPTVDLGTTTTLVISSAIRNASDAALEAEEQSTSHSNFVVVSDSQARNIEAAGNAKI